MRFVRNVSFVLFVSGLVSGCGSGSNSGGGNTVESGRLLPLDFTLISAGLQQDQPANQVLVAHSDSRFSDIVSGMPSMTGSVSVVDFGRDQVVSIVAQSTPCGYTELTGVAENKDVRQITVTEVTTMAPGLCDPTLEALKQRDYLMVAFESQPLPVSVEYLQRNEYEAVDADPEVPSSSVYLSSNPNDDSWVVGYQGQHKIRRAIRPFPAVVGIEDNIRPVFNFYGDYIDDVLIKSGNDEAAPIHMENTTVGANHGWIITKATAVGHGKTAADVGSIYSLEGREHVLVEVSDADSLMLADREKNTASPVGSYVYASGGATATDIHVTAVKRVQWRPSHVNRQIKVLVDDVEIVERDVELTFSDEVVFVESYGIQGRSAMVEAVIAEGVSIPSTDPIVSINLSYVFDTSGIATIYYDFYSHADITFSDIMLTQSAKGGVTDYYIPKTLPQYIDGVVYDFAQIDSASKTIEHGIRHVLIKPETSEPDGLLPDRVVGFAANKGMFAIGYLPLYAGAADVRRAQVTDTAIEIRGNTGKIYPHLVDTGRRQMAAGQHYAAIAYRAVTARSADRTAMYLVRTDDGAFLYLDWHDADMTDEIELPPDLVGHSVEVVESRNAQLLPTTSAKTLAFSVSAAGDYGFCIIRMR